MNYPGTISARIQTILLLFQKPINVKFYQRYSISNTNRSEKIIPLFLPRLSVRNKPKVAQIFRRSFFLTTIYRSFNEKK